jgi:phosphoglycerate dehydrogenase-like enzyme
MAADHCHAADRFDVGRAVRGRRRFRAAMPEARVFALDTRSPRRRFDQGERKEWIAEADVLVPLRGPIDEQVLALAARCRLIQQVGASVDSVDLAAAKRRGIPICNVPSQLGGNAESVAELALMHLIAAGRRLRSMQRSVEAEDFRVGAGSSLYEKTITIVGYGNIERAGTPPEAFRLSNNCHPAPDYATARGADDMARGAAL